MGILRTDKISGLETPTAVTGSVNFPGSDDYITAPANTPELLLGDADFTIEGWFYKTNTGQQDAFGLYNTASNRRSYLLTVSDSATIFYYNYTGSSGTNVTHSVTLPLNKWVHVAITRDGTTLRIYVDGKLSGTTTGLTAGAYANTDDQFMIGSSDYSNANGSEWTGHISNFRIVKGYVLYDGDFTVPDHALEVVPGTVLLACNNPDSVTAVESALVGKGLTLTAVNDVAVTSVTPGLTRDFTYGTEFKGVTTFNTQGYFVPPSGTTEQRGRGRGVIGWANNPVNTGIDYITISSMGNALKFGDLTSSSRWGSHGCASATRGLFAGGYINTPAATFYNIIEYVTISSTGNPVNFGDLTEKTYRSSCLASSTRGVFAHGYKDTPSAFTITNTISYVTIASLGDSANFGDLAVESLANTAALSSSTRGVIAGGVSPAEVNTMQYLTIATTGDTIDFGDLTENQNSPMATSSPTRGIIGGGYDAPTNTNTIGYITIASTGNAQDFGDLTGLYSVGGAVSNSLRGVFVGGYTSPSRHNLMEYVTISSTGNTKDFGDLLYARRDFGAFSDSHGGLS